MLILLPPSEGKTAPASGPSLDFSQLKYSQFNSLREKIATELIEISSRPDAREILRAGAAASDTIYAQRNLNQLPCAPAREVYTGVLFAALGLAQAEADLLDFVADKIIIFSGLFGVLSPSDPIPAYRLSMGTKLPKLGSNKKLWQRELRDFDLGENQLVIDCRSGNYQVWDPPKSADWVSVYAVREIAGKRKTVSHYAKHYRGVLARELVQTRTNLTDGEQLAQFALTHALQDIVTDVELAPPTVKGPRKLTLVLN